MAIYDDARGRSGFSIGEVLQLSFDVIGGNFAALFLAALLIVGGPLVLIGLWPLIHVPAFARFSPFAINWPVFWGMRLLGLICGFVLQAPATRVMARFLNNEPTSAREALAMPAETWLSLLALAAMLGLAFGFGFWLLVAPGVFVLTIWAATVPAYTVERGGLFDAFPRSMTLTEGHRAAICGVVLALGVLSLVVFFAGYVTSALFLSLSPLLGPLGIVFRLFSLAASASSNALAAVISSAGAAAIYAELRRTKEGVSPAQLAGALERK